MTFYQLQMFSEPDSTPVCPRCGYRFTPPPRPPSLSPVAETLLARIPTFYQPGERLGIEHLAHLTGYSVSRAHSGLVELALTRRGVQRRPIGDRKHVYIWQPDKNRK